jgi:hypothetical protein
LASRLSRKRLLPGGQDWSNEINLPDEEMLRRLVLRDGVQALRFHPHLSGKDCRYIELYGAKGRVCPWCEAYDRRAGKAQA